MGFFTALGLGMGNAHEATQQQQHNQQLNEEQALANEKRRQDAVTAADNRANSKRFYEQIQGVQGKDKMAKAYADEAQRADLAGDYKWGEHAAATATQLQSELSGEKLAVMKEAIARKDEVAKKAVAFEYASTEAGVAPTPESLKQLSDEAVAAGMPAAPTDPKKLPGWLMGVQTVNMDSKGMIGFEEKKTEHRDNQKRLVEQAEANREARVANQQVVAAQRDASLRLSQEKFAAKEKALFADDFSRRVAAEEYADGIDQKQILGGRAKPEQLVTTRSDAIAIIKEENPDFTPKQVAALLTSRQAAAKSLDAGATAFTKTAAKTVAAVTMASVEANDMMEVTKKFIAAHPDLNKYASTDINSLINMTKRHTSDPDLLKLDTYLFAITNSYSRATAPNGTLALMDREHARDKLASKYQGKSLLQVMEAMQQEMATAEKSARNVLQQGLRGSASASAGGGGQPKGDAFPFKLKQ